MELTLSEVKAACREAYKNRTLIAQHPHVDYGYERGRFGQWHCAIGCALNRETLDAIIKEDLQQTVLATEPVVPDSPQARLLSLIQVPAHERHEIYAIQTAHDAWLGSSGNRQEQYRERTDFLKLIDYRE